MLRLPRSHLQVISERIRRPEGEIAEEIRRAARGARRIGVVRQPRTGAHLPVFRTRHGGAVRRLLAKPLPPVIHGRRPGPHAPPAPPPSRHHPGRHPFPPGHLHPRGRWPWWRWPEWYPWYRASWPYWGGGGSLIWDPTYAIVDVDPPGIEPDPAAGAAEDDDDTGLGGPEDPSFQPSDDPMSSEGDPLYGEIGWP